VGGGLCFRGGLCFFFRTAEAAKRCTAAEDGVQIHRSRHMGLTRLTRAHRASGGGPIPAGTRMKAAGHTHQNATHGNVGASRQGSGTRGACAASRSFAQHGRLQRQGRWAEGEQDQADVGAGRQGWVRSSRMWPQLQLTGPAEGVPAEGAAAGVVGPAAMARAWAIAVALAPCGVGAVAEGDMPLRRVLKDWSPCPQLRTTEQGYDRAGI
jgi:hypothetical protein